MYNPTINFFGMEIDTNWVMICISLILMMIFNIIRSKKYNLKFYNGIIISILVNVFAIIGAILMYNIETLGQGFKMGLSFYGTVFFLPVAMLLISFIYKIDKRDIFDYWALTITMELAFVRFSCLLCGCCYGMESNWGIHYPFDPEGVYRFPIQLVEVILDLAIFIWFIFLERTKHAKGIVYPLFMVSYGLIRFILEFYRDTNKYFYGMSNGQLFSFLSVILGLLMFVLFKKRDKV